MNTYYRVNAANAYKTPQGNPAYDAQWQWLPPYFERPRGKFAVLGESLEYQSCVDWNERAYRNSKYQYRIS
jgi:hypothetical protein